MKTRSIDFTTGPITKKLLLFFVPILAGALLQQLYATMDAVVVGQFAGKEGLAAIDSVFHLIKLPLNFFTGLSTGAAILISQLYGAKKESELSRGVHTAVSFAFTGGVALTVIGWLAAPVCIRMLDVPAEIYPLALAYVRVYFSGMAASMVYNVGAGVLRAVGDSKSPFIYLIIGSTVNLALDLFFVAGLGMNVAGAALGTVIGQALSAALVVHGLAKRNDACRLVFRELKYHRDLLKYIFHIGLPLALQSALYPLANMIIQANVNAMGTDNIAAWGLCGKLDFLVWLIVDSLSPAIATFAAQNYGAQKYGRLKRGVQTGLCVTFAAVLLISVGLYVFCEPLARLFIRPQHYDIIPLVGTFMRFLAPLYFLYVFGEVFSGAICGTGQTAKPMLITLLATCLFRVAWILLLVPRHRTMLMIIGGFPASWALTAVCFTAYYIVFARGSLADKAEPSPA